MKKISNFLTNHLAFLIFLGVTALCTVFLCIGTKAENGSITLDGKDAKISEYTEEFIEDANAALSRIMNHNAPTDEETIEANEGEGQGFVTSLDAIKSRREPDGSTDNGTSSRKNNC